MSVEHQMNEKTATKLSQRIFGKMTAAGVLEPLVVDKSFPGVEITVRTRFHTIDTDELFFELLVSWNDKRTSSETEIWTDYKIKDGIPQLVNGDEGCGKGHGAQVGRCQARAQQLALLLEKNLKIAFES